MPLLEGDPHSFPRIIVSSHSMAENRTGNWRTLRPIIHSDKCTGCLVCWKYCPEACVDMTQKVPVINMDYCKGCGVCVEECPSHCIEMSPEETP